MKRLLLAGVGLATRGDCGARRRHAAGAPLPPPRAPCLCAVLHLERLLCRHQRRLRLRQLEWTDTVTRISTGKFNISGGAGRRHARLQCAVEHGRGRPRGRPRLERHQGLDHRQLPQHLRDLEQLARHRARPHRLCLRPVPALFHRRRGVRRGQRLGARLRQLQPDQVGWTGGGGLEYAFIDTGRPSSNISTSISARRPATRPAPAAIRSTPRSRPASCAAASTTSSEHTAAFPRNTARPRAGLLFFGQPSRRLHPHSYKACWRRTGETASFSLRSETLGRAPPSIGFA